MPGPLYTHSVNGKRLGGETKRTNERTHEKVECWAGGWLEEGTDRPAEVRKATEPK